MKFYRYELVEYGSLDQWGYPIRSNVKLELRTYDMIKETPKGYWIGHKGYIHGQKWVSRTAKKRYAYPTKDEALTNYIKRTESRIKILKDQLELCETGLRKAKYLTP